MAFKVYFFFLATYAAGINSFVHIVMYIYYGISALGPQFQKYLWWKRYLTQLQLVKLFILFFLIPCMLTCVTNCYSINRRPYNLNISHALRTLLFPPVAMPTMNRFGQKRYILYRHAGAGGLGGCSPPTFLPLCYVGGVGFLTRKG